MNERRECTGCAPKSRREFMERVSAALAVATVGASVDLTALAETSSIASLQTTLSYPTPAGDGVSIDEKEQIILVRFQGKVMAFPQACPHENTALRWRQRDLRFQCERHGSRYTPDGTFTSGRATRNMDRYAVSRSGAAVVVDLTKLYQSDTQAGAWASAAVAM